MLLRGLRYGWLLFVVLGWGVNAQSDFGRVAFSVLNDADIVHLSQVEFQTLDQNPEVISTFGLTQHTVLRQAPGQGLKRTLFFGNETAFSQTFTAVLIVDDSQVKFELDGVLSLHHAVTLGPGSQQRLNVVFPEFKKQGLHNFVLVVFYDIQEGGRATLRGIFPSYTDSVMVGTGPTPNLSPVRPGNEAFVQGHTVPLTLELPARGLTLNSERSPSDASSVLRSPLKVASGQAFEYYIHMRNGLPRSGDRDEFVLVALWDGVQIPTDVTAGSAVARFFLPLNGLATVKARLALPTAPGGYSLDVLAIRNPYALQTSTGTIEVLNAHLDFVLD